MVERLQLSLSEGTKKLASESIQFNPIVPETTNLHRDNNQETRQATVQLYIVGDDENVMSEPCCADCLNLLIGIVFCIIFVLVVCSIIGGYLFLIVHLFSLHTTASRTFACILLVLVGLLGAVAKKSEP